MRGMKTMDNNFVESLNRLQTLKDERCDYKKTLEHILNNLKILPENMTIHSLKDEIRDILKKYSKD